MGCACVGEILGGTVGEPDAAIAETGTAPSARGMCGETTKPAPGLKADSTMPAQRAQWFGSAQMIGSGLKNGLLGSSCGRSAHC